MSYSSIVLPPGLGGSSPSDGGTGGGNNSGGPFTGPLLAPFGSADKPGYAFVGAENMGVYGVSLGVIGLASQGRQIAQLDQAGNFQLAGGLSLQGGYLTQLAGSQLINTGAASAAGNVPAPPGSLFASSQGGTDGLQYKASGTDASGWVSILGPRTPLFPITAPTGSASALPLRFAGFLGTGLHSATGELALSVGGTDRLVLNADGSCTLSGSANLQSTLGVSGMSTLGGGLSVSGSATARNGLVVQGSSLVAQQGLQIPGGTLQAAGAATVGGQLTVQGLFAATSGSALSGRVTLDAGAQLINAPGDPRGVVSAPQGSVFFSSDGGPGKTQFTKEFGTGSDGWMVGSGGSGTPVYPLFAPQSSDGTTPQYAFDGGQAGMLSPSASALALSTAGVVRLLLGADGATSFSANVALAQALRVDGAATLGGTLAVSGLSTLAGATVQGSLQVAGTTTLADNVTAQKGLSVAGSASFGAALTASGGSTFSGSANVSMQAPLRLLGQVSLQQGNLLSSGHGSPQGVVAASVGSVYTDVDGGSFWVKQTGVDANGWAQAQTSGLPSSAFPLQAPDGAASAPSYSFLASPGSGLFADGTDSLALGTAGQKRLGISATGDASLSGALALAGKLSVGDRSTFVGGAQFSGNGTVNVGGLLHAQAASTVDGTFTAGQDAQIGGVLSVAGSSTLHALVATSAIFSGILQIADGAAATPGLALQSTPGSGFFADAAHSGLGVSIAGSQVGYFNASGYTSLIVTDPGSGGGSGSSSASYSTSADGSSLSPAFSVNGHGGLYWDGSALGLAVGGTEVAALSSSTLKLLKPVQVTGALSTDGSLTVTGASIYGKSLVIGADIQGQSASANGALIEGALAVGPGTAASPSLRTSSAAGTGLFYDATHSGLGVSVAGSQVGYFSTGGYTSVATGASAPLIDLVVNSAASNNLTLAVGNSLTSVPTQTFVGTTSASNNYLQAGSLVFGVTDADAGSSTLSRLYSLSAGGYPNHALTLARAGQSTPILRYDDATGRTTLGLPVSIANLSVSAQQLLASATASTPAVGFSAAPQTGLYYDASHNGIGVSVGGTQIGYFNASGYNPLTGGTAMNVVAPIVTVSSGTYQLTAGQSGCLVNFTASAAAALPAANTAAVGTYFTFMVGAAGTTASVAIAAANTADSLYFVGGTVTAGQALTSQASRYALLSVECNTPGQWTVVSVQGVWGGQSTTIGQTDTLIISPDGNNLTLDSSGAPGTSASERLISPSGQPSLLRFASGTPSAPVDAWALSGLAGATASAAFRLANSQNGYNVFSYTDSGNTAATRAWAFGNVNVTGVQSLTVGQNGVADTTLPVQLNVPASSFAALALSADTSGKALSLGYSNAASGIPTGGYLSTRVAQPMFFTANGLTQTALNYTSAGLVGIGSATASLSALGVFGGTAIGSGIAGTTAAPTNGLLVQGATTLQSTLGVTGASTFTGAATFNGSATFNGTVTGVTASPTYPLAAPTGTTASPNLPYGFAAVSNAGLWYNTTTSALNLQSQGINGLQVMGYSVGVGGFTPLASDVQLPLSLNTAANTNTVIAFLNQGNNGSTIGHNNSAAPLGLWIRAKGATDAINFTTANGTAGAVNYALRIGSNTGTSFGTSAAAPVGGIAVQGIANTLGGIFAGPTPPTSLTAGMAFLASNSAETGVSDVNGVTAQVSSTGKLYARYSLADTNVAVGDLTYNKYTTDGVPVAIILNCYNKPFLLNVGADYTRTAMSVYNVSNSYFCNIGARTQALSTLGVTGSLAVGATVAAGTAAPANGLLVQGNATLQSALTVTGAVTPGSLILPTLAQNNSISLPVSFSGYVLSLAAGTATLPVAAPGLNYTIIGTGNAITVSTNSASDVMYWGGNTTLATGAPTSKASGTSYAHAAGARGVTLQVKCVSANVWNITQLVGTAWT